jgi:phage tail sheath gpL-like
MATISFDTIPANLRTPAVVAEFSSVRAQAGLAIQPFKVLLIGQRLATLTRATGTLVLGGQPSDADTYVISDGATSVTFEFDSNSSVVQTNTLRQVVIGVDVAATAAALLAAINATPSFNVTALTVTGGNTVNLRNDAAGTVGNVAITEPVNVSTFLSDTGMTGGAYTATGSGTTGQAYRIGSAQEASNLWGAGSQIHRAALAFFANNAFTEVWGIAIDDPLGGAAASGTIAVTGPATAAGTVYVYVGGNRYAVAVASGDSASVVAASIATAINADTLAPFTAAAISATITLTARNLGLVGNFLDIRHSHNAGEVLPAGVGLTITAFAGGAGGIDLAATFAAIGDEWFNVICSPYAGSTNLQAFAAELESRWGPLRANEAFGFVSATGDVSGAISVASVVNSGHLAVIPAQGSPTWTVEIAAAAAAVVSFYAAIDPARPWNGLPLIGVVPPLVKDRWTLSQRNSLLFAGVSTTRVDDGGRVVLERVVSSYRTNSVGAADTAYLDATTHFTLSYLRFDLTTTIKLKYPRSKLANDSSRLAAGQAIVTPGIMRGELVARALLWETQGLVEDVEGFKADLLVERDTSDPTRLNFQIPPNLVNPLMVVAGRFTFVL